MTDLTERTAWHRLRRKIMPRITLILWGDRNGVCGARACVVWLGWEWLDQEIEMRKQNG